MPITKKPVVHKFGIISHTQRLQLQERLLKKSYSEAFREQSVGVNRNPVEISDQFVSRYNDAKSLEEREKLDVSVRKILERIKRKVGLKDGGQGSHVDLPFAWTDLSLLAQCKGQIQEDCLDVFIGSLERAPLTIEHLPVLFYLAETSLYWLRTDAVKQPYLRAAEIKLLRMGELVFLQLFYHHMAGHLETYTDAKRRLFTYLNGLQECQEVYNPYPNALFSLRYINEVGKIIVSDVIMEQPPREPSEVGEYPVALETDSVQPTSTEDPVVTETGALDPSVAKQHSDILENFTRRQTTVTMETRDSGRSSRDERNDTLSRSVHDLSPTLWHALDIWRCSSQLSGGLQEALLAVTVCGRNINKENWIDGVLALKVMSEAARCDQSVLRTMLNLAQGVQPKQSVKKHSATSQQNPSHKSSVPSHGSGLQSPPTLSDIQERSESSNSTPFDVISQDSRPTNPISHRSKHKQQAAPSTSSGSNQSESGVKSRDEKVDQSGPEIVSRDLGVDQSENGKVEQQNIVDQSEATSIPIGQEWNDEVAPPDGGFVSDHMCVAAWAELNSERADSPGSNHTYTNKVSDQLGIHGWHWEVAVTYTHLLTDLVIHGSTSHIQKRALIGSNQEIPLRHQKGIPMRSCGLVDLVYFKAATETSDLGPDDWSWRVRYSALQGLVTICRVLDGHVSRDGTRSAAWSVLSRVRGQETDARVMEALKVGQVELSVGGGTEPRPSSIHSQIAARLAAIYLPPLPPVVATYTPRKQTSKRQPPTYKRDTKPLRTTLKDEVLLATAFEKKIPDYKTRGDFDLRRVVEDQWRKEVQRDFLAEEEQRRKELMEEQKKKEEEQENRMETKEEKLANNKRPTGTETETETDS